MRPGLYFFLDDAQESTRRMFFFGIFFPLLWLIGAFMQPARGASA